MKQDGDTRRKRRGIDVVALALPLVATFALLACSACKGFFVDPTLLSVALTPTGATILVGATQQYQAIGTYDDGSTKVVSPVWTSSAPASATISAGGLAKGVAAGTATITATLGAVTGTTTLTVQVAPPLAITVTPANPSISLSSGSQQFTATGTYANAPTQDLTSTATWTSSNALVVASSFSAGSATVLAVGNTVITASVGAVSGTTTLTVK